MWILLFLILVTFVLALVPGAGLVAIVPAALAVAYVIWLLTVYISGHSLTATLRGTHRERHLGPGGPDDPDRTLR